MTRDLVSDANENLRRSIGALAEAVDSGEGREFGPLAVHSSGLPAPIFNRVFVFEPPPADELSAAVGWLSERDADDRRRDLTAAEPPPTGVDPRNGR